METMTSPSDEPDDGLKRGAKFIVCSQCKEKSTRMGTEHWIDVYKCELNHIIRIKVGRPREQWNMD